MVVEVKKGLVCPSKPGLVMDQEPGGQATGQLVIDLLCDPGQALPFSELLSTVGFGPCLVKHTSWQGPQ